MFSSLSLRRLVPAFALAALVVSSAPGAVFADPADDDDVPGEAVIKTPFEFVKFSVNGKTEWENHEYTGRRKTLVIMGLSRSDDNVVVLTPRVDGYEPLTITITSKDYKRRKIRRNGKRIAVYRFTTKARFAKVGAAKPAKPAKKKAKAKAKKTKKKK